MRASSEQLIFVRIAKNWVVIFVKLVRNRVLPNPVVTLDLIQLEPSIRIILKQPLDQIASTLLDARGKSVLRVDNSSVGLVLLLSFERRASLKKILGNIFTRHK